jgi:hypothetical protein
MAKSPGQAADRVATEVQERIERLATLAADAILHSLYAPQVVAPPRDQALDYWATLFFTPDGYVNQPGRDRVLRQVGGAEYKKIALDLARDLRRDTREAAAETPLEPTPPVAAPPPTPEPAPEPTVPPLYGPRTQPVAA